MKFIKIQNPEDIYNEEEIEELYPTAHKPDDASLETGLALGSSLGGLLLGGRGLVNSLEPYTRGENFNAKPLLRGASLGLGTAIAGKAIAGKIVANKRKAFKEKLKKEQPDYDPRLSPYAFYNDSRPIATFRKFVDIPVNKELVDELDLSEKEKYLGAADPKTLAAQTALIGLPAAYTARQNRKIQRAKVGENLVREIGNNLKLEAIKMHISPQTLREHFRRQSPKFIEALDRYEDLIESPMYKNRLQNANIKSSLGLGAAIGGTLLARHLGKKALEERAKKKTEAYLDTKNFSKNNSFVNFSAFDKADTYNLPANKENPIFPSNMKYHALPLALNILGAGALAAGSIMEPFNELQYFNRDKINKDIPLRVDRAVNNVKRLKGKPSIGQHLYRISNLSPKTYRNIGRAGLGLIVAGGVIGANNNSGTVALQRQLQTQAQLEAIQRKKEKRKKDKNNGN